MPAHRLKTYSAENGFVYQYYFLESKVKGRFWGWGGTAFFFHVTRDQKRFFVSEVLVEDAAVKAWEKRHGRALAEQERYAAAKMALFRAFDESSREDELFQVRVSEANIESLLEPLALDE
jgi:hypothetical protein